MNKLYDGRRLSGRHLITMGRSANVSDDDAMCKQKTTGVRVEQLAGSDGTRTRGLLHDGQTF
jgi:hypothetical protein